MPAVSKKQQRFFGIVRAIQKGEMAPTTPETAKAAADMKKSDVKDFASTKHKKLPEKKVAKEAADFSQRDKILKRAKPLHKHLYKNLHKGDRTGDVNEESNPRIPRKKGQPANSKKHSDLYTDENPKGTIHGLGFKDVATAKASVSKIRKSSRSHAHKIQAAVAMEQRAREMGKTSEAAVYRKFINTMKKKTEKMNESFEIDPKLHRKQQRIKKIRDRTKTGDEGSEIAKKKIKGPKLFGEAFRSSLLSDKKYMKRIIDQEKRFKEEDSRKKFGKFYKDIEAAKNKLRPGEVKKFNKQTGKWESNLNSK